MISVFIAGLLGSFHCIGMCGPLLVVHAALTGKKGVVVRQLVLHAGRTATYVVLGIAGGLAGIMIGHGGRLAGLQAAASLTGGALMVVMAASLFGLTALARFVVPVDPRAVTGRVKGLLTRSGLLGNILLGVYWGFLPCGLVWAFAVRALATGSPLRGALVMLVFAASTLPVLLLTTATIVRLPVKLRRIFDRLAAAAVLAMGLLLLARGAAFNGWIPHVSLMDYLVLF